MAYIEQQLAKKLRVSLIFLVCLAGSGFALAQDKHIDISVVQTDGAYKMQFVNSECPERPNLEGCVLAAHGNSPNISWELASLLFSPDGVKWGDPNHPLKDCTMEDFNLSAADQYSGVASTAQVVANGHRLKIKDGNFNQCITHYLLVARSRSSGQEIDSDPVIDNRGGGPR